MTKGRILILILALIIAGGGFLIWENNQDKKEINQEVQNEERIGNNYEMKDEIINYHFDLTEEEIDNLKKNNDLVWYYIQELDIKFKVSPDANKDLKYNVKEFSENGNKQIVVYLYRQSVVDFLGKDWCFNDDKNLCTDGNLYKADNLLSCQNVIGNFENEVICFGGSQASNFKSKIQYNEYLKKIKNKDFDIYLTTVELNQK